jgi:hypothetical protein
MLHRVDRSNLVQEAEEKYPNEESKHAQIVTEQDKMVLVHLYQDSDESDRAKLLVLAFGAFVIIIALLYVLHLNSYLFWTLISVAVAILIAVVAAILKSCWKAECWRKNCSCCRQREDIELREIVRRVSMDEPENQQLEKQRSSNLVDAA